jgi:CHAD domain-containing protein
MPYRLKPARPVDKELSAIVDRQFEKALDAVGRTSPCTNATHDARTAIKKIRAILRLLQVALGRKYRESNKRLRSIAHQLSASRDAVAAVETLAALHRQYPRVVNRPIVTAVRKGLLPRTRTLAAPVQPEVMRRQLAAVARYLPRRIQQVAGRSEVRDGTVQGYARARRALHRVQAAPEAGRFHAWRRRVKDHWYQVRLMEARQPAVQWRIKRLKRLEVLLGDDHNLVLLRDRLMATPGGLGNARTTAIVLGCIVKYHAALRDQAVTIGERLFAPTPRSFAKSLRSSHRRR